jgi:hypothetical protein
MQHVIAYDVALKLPVRCGCQNGRGSIPGSGGYCQSGRSGGQIPLFSSVWFSGTFRPDGVPAMPIFGQKANGGEGADPVRGTMIGVGIQPGIGVAYCLTGILLAAVFSGCETPGWAERLDQAFTFDPPDRKQSRNEEEQHRKKYAATRDRDALHWLLRHRIDSGMSYHDVCRTLGEDGSRESRDNWIKNNGGNYQVGDDVYAFGPDSKGQTLYLVFRDDKLVNFDPKEFSSTAHRKRPKEADEE